MTPEGAVEDHLVKRIKALGGMVRKCKWIGRRGAPDRLVLLKGEHTFVELKRPGKDGADDHQAREHERLRWAGFTVLVLNTKAQIDAAFPEPEPDLL